MLNPGTIIGNRYQINEKIGTGGMSDVYRAVDTVLGREVAIKVLKQEFAEDASFVAKFRAEATSAAGLEHPNIVNIYDVGSDLGLHFIVMEYVEGITLKTYIEKKVRLNFKEAVSIAIQVGRGIEAAHAKGIVHRDIKPQNIMISREGKVKVTDFGIARAATANTIHGDVMGSVHYASPEQTRNGYVDGKSDIYSLGIVMYEMVTGRVPFDGESTVAVALQHLQNDMVPPSQYAPDLPYSLERIIQKSTMKSSDRRYGNIGELLSDLKMSLQDPDGDFVVITEAAGATTKFMRDDRQTQASFTERVNLSERPYQQPEPNPYDYMDDQYSANQQQMQYHRVQQSAPVYEEDEDEYEAPAYEPRDRYKQTPKNKRPKERFEDDLEDDFYDDDFRDEPRSIIDKIFTGLGVAAGVIIIVIIGIVIGNILGVIKGDGAKETVNMVNLTGLTTQAAQEKLVDLGLTNANIKVEFLDVPAGSNVKPGTIASQSVLGKEKFSLSDVLVLQVYRESSGSVNQQAVATPAPQNVQTDGAHVILPNVVGYTEENAMSTLKDLGLKPARTYQYDENQEKGNVVSQSPVGDAQVLNGATVNLVISKGSARVTVPNVIGYTEADATALLEAEGLNVGQTKTVASSDQEEGVVLSQSIEGDRVVENGTTITLTVGGGATSGEYNFTIKIPSDLPASSVHYTTSSGHSGYISGSSSDSFRISGEDSLSVVFDWTDEYGASKTETYTFYGTLVR